MKLFVAVSLMALLCFASHVTAKKSGTIDNDNDDDDDDNWSPSPVKSPSQSPSPAYSPSNSPSPGNSSYKSPSPVNSTDTSPSSSSNHTSSPDDSKNHSSPVDSKSPPPTNTTNSPPRSSPSPDDSKNSTSPVNSKSPYPSSNSTSTPSDDKKPSSPSDDKKPSSPDDKSPSPSGGVKNPSDKSEDFYYNLPGTYAGSCVQLAAQTSKGYTCVDKGNVVAYPYYIKWSQGSTNGSVIANYSRDAVTIKTSAKRTWSMGLASIPSVQFNITQAPSKSGMVGQCLQSPVGLGSRQFRMYTQKIGNTVTYIEEGAVWVNSTSSGCQSDDNMPLFCSPKGYNYRCVAYALQ